MKRHFTFSSPKQKYLLLGLLVLALAGSAVWLKYYSPYGPDPLRSSANEVQPHWPYSTQPANIKLMDSSSSYWENHLAIQLQNWEKKSYVKYATVLGDPKIPCYQYPEVTNFCTVNDPDFFVVFGSYVFWERTGHIITGHFILNDYYLNNPGTYFSTPEARNKTLCSQLGWGMGLSFRYFQGDKSTTCMEALWVPERVPNQQQPDEEDLAQVKERYASHQDDDSSSAISAVTAKANRYLKDKNYGQLVDSLANGQEIYKLDLGDGFVMQTILQKAPDQVRQKK